MIDNHGQALEDYKAYTELENRAIEIDRVLTDAMRVFILYLSSLVNAKFADKMIDDGLLVAKQCANATVQFIEKTDPHGEQAK